MLNKLNEIVKEREDNYDNPLPNFLRIALYWSLWRHEIFTPLDVIFMMDLMKTAREMHNHSDDTLLDKVGYTVSCYERIDSAMKDLGYSGIEYFRKLKDRTHGVAVGSMFELLTEWEKHETSERSSTGV